MPQKALVNLKDSVTDVIADIYALLYIQIDLDIRNWITNHLIYWENIVLNYMKPRFLRKKLRGVVPVCKSALLQCLLQPLI